MRIGVLGARDFEDRQLASYILANVKEERKMYEWPAIRAEWLKLYLSLL